ncbi:MAG: hypothetical protein PGN16_05100 [Sphingomonas phyllosphaerae]|uniref:hypothetical protein n=1 Tax=Sphingomonas phyllosphaerae TaxID=257003 RepID=UPI002FF49199
MAGCVVLVVEDEYFIATDTADALKEAGAIVLGPCPGPAEAMRILSEFRPSHAVLDLNLDGSGARFEVARALKDQHIQSVIVTGYDPSIVPADLADTLCLQKPVLYHEVVEAVAAQSGRYATPRAWGWTADHAVR